MAEVEEYALAWHPMHGGRIRIKKESQNWGPWVPVSSEGLAAFSALMREKPVHASNNGWLRTGPEPVGEEEN